MVSSKFRNKIRDREKYYSDKEINYIHVFQKKINHEKYGMSKEGIHVFQKKLIIKNMACPKKASPYIDVTSKITRNRGSASAITIPSSAEVVRQVNTDASKNSLQNAEEESHDVADQIETGEIYKIFKGYCSFKIKITLNNYLNSQIQIPMNIIFFF